MNYFELFDLMPALKIDQSLLRTRFYQLSRQYHPDRFTGSSDEEQAEMLEKSSLVNKAYKTLQQPDETIGYLLTIHQLLEENEKYTLDPEFLMDVMEINEELEETDNPATAMLQSVEQKALTLQDQIYKDVEEIIENYKEGISTKEELLRLKEYYFRKKYLQRILDRISGMRNIASRI